MKLKFLTLSTFLLVITGAVTASTTVSELSTSNIEPGGEFTLKVTISNPEFDERTYKPLKLDLPQGFTVVERPDEGLKTLCGSCKDERVFRVKADSNIDSGTYRIDVKPDESYNEGYGQEEQFTITVDGHPNLVLKLERPEIKQGEQEKVLMEIENIGTDSASEVVISPENGKISFQPGTITVDEIIRGETFSQSVTVNADESLSSGVHETTIKVYYKDEKQQRTYNSQVSIKALEKSSVVVSSMELGQPVIGQKMDTIIELENQGPGEAKNISTRLNCKNGSTNKGKAFMGQLAEDESVPAVFEVTPEKENVQCTMKINYIDSQEKQVTETFTITAQEKPLPVMPLAAILGLFILNGVYLVRR